MLGIAINADSIQMKMAPRTEFLLEHQALDCKGNAMTMNLDIQSDEITTSSSV
jgi:hypothetical protein